MPRIEPAYRTRPRDPRAYAQASRRYAQLLDADRRRRELVAVRMAVPGGRSPWVGLAIDYLAVPALWALAVGLAVAHPWMVALYALHLAAVWALLRWG